MLLGISGWEADAALTWFSAFASLMLMIGLATWLSGRKLAALLVLLVCVTGSLRPLLAFIPGIDAVIMPQTGFAGWLFQTAWVPQHIASASCVVLAMLLLSELVRRESLALLAAFVLVVVAGAGSSTWVGGVTFAVAAIWIGGVPLANAEPQQRMPLLGRFAIAAIGAAVLAAPILYDQLTAMGTRGGGSPDRAADLRGDGRILPAGAAPVPRHAGVLADPPGDRAARDLPRPASMRCCTLTKTLDPARKRAATILIHLAGASLAVSWLMVSTIGGNNDLGWRAVLPACLVLTVFAVAGLTQWIRTRIRLAIAGFVAIALGLPSGISILNYDIVGTRDPAGEAFAATPEMWAAVRRHAGPADRVGNNPMFLESMTPWPVNISWALLVEPALLLRRLRPRAAVHPAAARAAAGDRRAVQSGVFRRRLARRPARSRHQIRLQGRGGDRARRRLDPRSRSPPASTGGWSRSARRAGASTSPAPVAMAAR